MDNTTCRICNKEFETESSLHKHLKAHKLLLPEYYRKYMPKFDKFNGQPIEFKNKEQYLNCDFNSRDNLRNWFKKTDRITARAYAKMVLELRIDRKKLVWTPTQVELRSAMMPPIQCYNELFGNYYELCGEMGLKNKFDYNTELEFVRTDYKILVDNREQLPLDFKHETEWATLKVGDYACNIDYGCFIERKSAPDLLGTLSGGYERFSRELDRATASKSYLVVLVEESLNNCLHFDTLPNVYHKGSKITPEFIFHNIRETIQKYPNMQFLFVDSRNKASEIIEKIFDSGAACKNIDLQFYLDTRKL